MTFLSVGVRISRHEAFGPSFNRYNQILSSQVIRLFCLCHVRRVACKEVGERGLMLGNGESIRGGNQIRVRCQPSKTRTIDVRCEMTEQDHLEYRIPPTGGSPKSWMASAPFGAMESSARAVTTRSFLGVDHGSGR